ncbi:hypothetical protein RhiLY_01958 [Ceratobasidium sp. AG-Ba]|nr:hypothetical protein RhiLY_01958 [Ceratobasidium sp. AG-Ba]
MDQDSFRSLLKSSAPPTDPSKSKAYNRGSLLASGSSQAKKPDTPQAAFKPRKVKKPTDSKYRDRASERRGGINEYAEVEGLLKEFETRTAGEDRDVVEEQRKYLGGDATHTVLVKGLDFALLEQNRAREETRDDLDDDLESAFLKQPTTETTPTPNDAPPSGSKKRTRAELLAELQRSRSTNDSTQDLPKPPTREEELQALERAKQAGKFKPIGASSFAPVEKKKKKKKKVTTDLGSNSGTTSVKNEKAKNKQEAPEPNEDNAVQSQVSPESSVKPAALSASGAEAAEMRFTPDAPASAPTPSLAPVHAPAPVSPAEEIEDVDPFADVGDYEPDYGDDSDAEGGKSPKETQESPSAPPVKRNWFNDPDPEPTPLPTKQSTPPPQPTMEIDEPEPDKPMRLESLSSSAMPSISQFLAMDKEEAEREKKRARKEKKKKAG